MTLERQIRRFIQSLLDGVEIEGDPLAGGALDSLAMEQLIAFLEDRYGVEFADDELVAERFASISTTASLVREKRKARPRNEDLQPHSS